MEKSLYSEKHTKLTNWLKESREAQGMTMRELGAKMNVPHSFIGKVEQGERRLDVCEYVQYCNSLQIDPVIGIDLLSR